MATYPFISVVEKEPITAQEFHYQWSTQQHIWLRIQYLRKLAS